MLCPFLRELAFLPGRKWVCSVCLQPRRGTLCFWEGTALLLEEWAESRRQWSALAVKALVILNVLF